MIAESVERGFLGALLRDGSLCKQVSLSVGDFSTARNGLIYAAACERAEVGLPTDWQSIAEFLEERGDLGKVGGKAYLCDLIDGAVPHPKLVANRAESIRNAAKSRRILKVVERLYNERESATNTDIDQRLEEINRIRQEYSSAETGYRDLFHSYEECVNAPPLRFAINGFLQEDALTMIGGLSGDGKTLMMLAMVRSLLSGSPLFNYPAFSVDNPAERVIYLIPEVAIGPFWHRLQLFRLDKYVQEGKLLIRTLSSREQMSLSDSRFLEAANGAHVFLDTAVRFIEGEENSASETKVFADTLFKIQAAGAKTVTGAHHSPKSLETADYLTLENVLRGSGDFGAMLASCWGIRQIDETSTRIYVQNVKPRDFQPCEPFIIDGRPFIDDHGTFMMYAEPGQAGELKDRLQTRKAGRREDTQTPEKKQQAFKLLSERKSYRDIASALGVGKSTVSNWARQWTAQGSTNQLSTNCPAVDGH